MGDQSSREDRASAAGSFSRWTKLSQEQVTSNPWWTYRRDRYQLPNGATGEYHYVHTEGASMIIPVDDDDRLVMVRQYRYLCNRDSLEFPCGGVKPESSYDQTAAMELAEEAGLSAESLTPAGEFNPYNGVTDEVCRVYLARGLKPGSARPDETEEFSVVRLTPEELEDRISAGHVWDGMTLAAWSLVKKNFIK